MPDFKIVFSGLMCHVKIDSQTRAAAVISDSHHSPRIWVSPNGVIGNPHFPKQEQDASGWQAFAIPPNARIQFAGLETGQLDDPPDPEVPHITELIPHFVPADAILATQQHDWVHGYVLYSKGAFSVPCFYPGKAHFDGSVQTEFKCRAKELLLTATSDPNANVDIIDTVTGHSMTVSNTAIIGITHIDKHPALGQPPKDHQLYKNVAKDNVAVLQIQTLDNACPPGFHILPPAAFLNSIGIESVSVECMSTQWP
jgi:hypothetical protein